MHNRPEGRQEHDVVPIESLSDAAILQSGSGVAFTINTPNESTRVQVRAVDLGHILVFLSQCARHLGEHFPPDANPLGGAVPLVEADGLGLAHGNAPDTATLVVNLAGYKLGFQVPAKEMLALMERWHPLALTLSTPIGRPQ